LRILSLPAPIIEYLRNGKLSAGHARAILASGDKERMIRLAKLAVTRGLSVERLDIIAREEKPSPRHLKMAKRRKPLSPEESAILDAIRAYLGTKVKINSRAKGGVIVIEYFSSDDLKRIAELLSEK
jgi:ParB family chromosome partitioning protein